MVMRGCSLRRLDRETKIERRADRTSSSTDDQMLAPNTCGKKMFTASIETTDVSQITAPQAAASHRPTAATRSITAKNTVAVCQAIG